MPKILKRFVEEVGKECREWEQAVAAIQREVEGGKGVHQAETDRRNMLRAAENVSLQAGTSGRGKETESN